MTKRQYAKMDWEAIESIVYSDNAHPFDVLSPQKSGKDTLIQAFLPFAQGAEVVFDDKNIDKIAMELVDEEGFYAAFVPGTGKKSYCFQITTKDGESLMVQNPYDFAPVVPKDSLNDFVNGNATDAYRILGAHFMNLNGVSGANFAVWAPNALRVSVIGEWNKWDGRVNPMQKLDEYGVFTLFVPGIKIGDAYRFEVKIKGNEILIKDDPYAMAFDKEGKAVVCENVCYEGEENAYNRISSKELCDKPVQICQFSFADFMTVASKGRKKISTMIKDAVGKLSSFGYTHVELAPLCVTSNVNSGARHILFYYATSSSVGDVQFVNEFVNECHKAGIAVLMDCPVAYFAKDSNGLEWFDGTGLYEHSDSRLGYQPVFDAKVFRYQCPEVKSFLFSNAFFWMKRCHLDGFVFHDLASVLYLDYGRTDWISNAYGGKENFEFIDFIKKLNRKIKMDFPGSITIADIDAVWGNVSEKHKDSLGFDWVWNNGFQKDIVSYVQTQEGNRNSKLLPMLSGLDYAYNENFILPISSDITVKGELKDIIGTEEERYAVLRSVYAYAMLYPGKKLYCPDVLSFVECAGKKTERSEYSNCFDAFVMEMNKLYKEEKILAGFDDSEGSLEWVNHQAHVSNVITFIRKSGKKKEFIYVVANFSETEHAELKLVAPYQGKYTEILSTDSVKYGGKGCCNVKTIATEEVPYDERTHTITVKAAPMSVSVYHYKPFTAKELADIAEHKRQLRIAYAKAERSKIEKRRDEIIAEAIKDAENRIKELEKILDEK